MVPGVQSIEAAHSTNCRSLGALPSRQHPAHVRTQKEALNADQPRATYPLIEPHSGPVSVPRDPDQLPPYS
ncbi:TPA: hypothetical protein L6A84_32875, partial [Pseudomonas aeruginosa]|nr:hypothetical protein [Pseudomonas aeruginosa]